MEPNPWSQGIYCRTCFVKAPWPALKKKRLVWYRNRSVSYSREMDIEDLKEDGTVKGEIDGWWEPWPGK